VGQASKRVEPPRPAAARRDRVEDRLQRHQDRVEPLPGPLGQCCVARKPEHGRGGRDLLVWAQRPGGPESGTSPMPDELRHDADPVRAAGVPDAGTGRLLVTVAAPTNPVSATPTSSPSMARIGHQLVVLGGAQQIASLRPGSRAPYGAAIQTLDQQI
jgi:hypothetical protein